MTKFHLILADVLLLILFNQNFTLYNPKTNIVFFNEGVFFMPRVSILDW